MEFEILETKCVHGKIFAKAYKMLSHHKNLNYCSNYNPVTSNLTQKQKNTKWSPDDKSVILSLQSYQNLNTRLMMQHMVLQSIQDVKYAKAYRRL